MELCNNHYYRGFSDTYKGKVGIKLIASIGVDVAYTKLSVLSPSLNIIALEDLSAANVLVLHEMTRSTSQEVFAQRHHSVLAMAV